MNAPFKVRASSWASLFDCAARWEATHILGLRMPSSPRATLGKSIHHGTAVFDMGRIIGQPVDVVDAVQETIDQIQHPTEDVDWSGGDLTPREMQSIAATLVTKYCLEVSPLYEFEAVELTTKPLRIDCGGGTIIELTGQLDRSRVHRSSYGRGIADLKSGRAAVVNGMAKTKGHKAQIGTYEILYEHTTGEQITAPGEIIALPTSGKPQIATGEIRGAKEMMLGTPEEKGLIQHAVVMFRNGSFPPNPASVLCSPRYCVRWSRCKAHD